MGGTQTNPLYGVEGAIVHTISLRIDCYWWLQYTQWINVNVTDVSMKNHHYASFFWHVECEWNASCTCDRTYRDTAPLNLILKSACTACPVLNVCSSLYSQKHSDLHRSSIRWHGDEWIMCTIQGARSKVKDWKVKDWKNVQFETTQRMSFWLKMVTHKQLVCLSATHRKSFCLSVTYRKFLLFPCYT